VLTHDTVEMTSSHKEHQKLLIHALKSLSNEDNTQIILTTHSSDVVKSLNFSNLRLLLKDKDSTIIKTIETNYLPYPSLNEVNYIAFNDIGIEYHNELYGFLQSKAMDDDNSNSKEEAFDNWLVSKGCAKNKSWVKISQGNIKPPVNHTIQTYIRDCIHHPENDKNAPFTDEELNNSILQMTDIIKVLD